MDLCLCLAVADWVQDFNMDGDQELPMLDTAIDQACGQLALATCAPLAIADVNRRRKNGKQPEGKAKR